MGNIKTQVHVATSDFTEQWAIFGQGAIRKSARELLNEMNSIESRIKNRVKKIEKDRPSSKIAFPDDVMEKLEKWSRGNL